MIALEPTNSATNTATWSAVQDACSRIAPQFPISNFVAVNPYLGLTSRHFISAATLMQAASHGRTLMPISWYREQWAQGKFKEQDIETALAYASRTLPADAAHFIKGISAQYVMASLVTDEVAPVPVDHAACIRSPAELLDLQTGTRCFEATGNEVTRWCASWFTADEAGRNIPQRSAGLYAWWQASAKHDRSAEIAGIVGLRGFVAGLPQSSFEAICHCLEMLQPAPAAVADLMHRLLLSAGGWSGIAAQQVEDTSLLVDLLAILLAYHVAIFKDCCTPQTQLAWRTSIAGHVPGGEITSATVLSFVCQCALEFALQRSVAGSFTLGPQTPASGTPLAQMVFCIDVRSEPMRRALEQQSDRIETVGFAGFFGFPIEYVPVGSTHGTALCPALIKPRWRVHEFATAAQALNADQRSRSKSAWKAMKTALPGSCSFVEAAGLLNAAAFVKDILGIGNGKQVVSGTTIVLDTDDSKGLAGISLEDQIDAATAALKNMGLTHNFAKLVLFCGHGSSSVNNAYGAALDCGACGGHTGENNARIAAQILNSQPVRAGLKHKGIEVPEDTWFLPALHDTTVQELQVFDTEKMPELFQPYLEELKLGIKCAEQLLQEEAKQDRGTTQSLRRSNRNWAETMPEWGLAGNAAFIAAPRARTVACNLKSRAFLHNYHSDQGPDVLKLILAAPLVVAAWINLQYFASTVDNEIFGSGTKTAHNLVGNLGVISGNGGPLRMGLPKESVMDGDKLRHEPLRLSAFIEAPRTMLNDAISVLPAVCELLDNGWVHLIAIEEEGAALWRYVGNLRWVPADAQTSCTLPA